MQLHRILPVFVGLFLFSIQFSANAQFQWPDNPENLKVLPEDISSQQLGAIMRGFTSALGVRCEHCHDDRNGSRLSEMDFASDFKETKQTTRVMLRMVRTLNTELLAPLGEDGHEVVQVTCVTCHRGYMKPVMVQDKFRETLEAEGLQAAIAEYREMRERYYGSFAFDYTSRPLNALGYELLGEGQVDNAISVFRLNVEMNPDESNVYDSLAEGYLARGDVELATIFYQKALELNPANRSSLEALAKIRSDQDAQ